MNTESAAKVLGLFPKVRVLVVGDLLLDEYLWGHVQRISPEAPVPILNIVRREYALGGAGNVVKNLRTLGAKVRVVGALGDDKTGDRIVESLEELKVTETVVREHGRKSSHKTRLMSLEHGQQVFRFDEESVQNVAADTEAALIGHLETEIAACDVVLCSDYMKGVLTERVLRTSIQNAKKHRIPVVVAPKDSRPDKYRGADILVPNLKELMQLSSTTSLSSFESAAAAFMSDIDVRSIVVTRGSEGISLFERDGNSVRHLQIPTAAKTVYDVTGAGDTFVSTFTLSVAAGANHESAAALGNAAAGIVVGKRGTASVTVSEVEEALRQGVGVTLSTH